MQVEPLRGADRRLSAWAMCPRRKRGERVRAYLSACSARALTVSSLNPDGHTRIAALNRQHETLLIYLLRISGLGGFDMVGGTGFEPVTPAV